MFKDLEESSHSVPLCSPSPWSCYMAAVVMMDRQARLAQRV